MELMIKLYNHILKNYGETEDQELCEIFSDAGNYVMSDIGSAEEIGHRFAKWEKRNMEDQGKHP